jgi:hypothetical protein
MLSVAEEWDKKTKNELHDKVQAHDKRAIMMAVHLRPCVAN